MSSKIILFLFICFAIVLMITTEVAARDLAETSTSLVTSKQAEETNGVNDAKYGGGYGGNPGGGYGGNPGGYGGNRDGYGGKPGGYGGNPGRGGYCSYGCCGREYNGNGCTRCCGYVGEAVDAVPEVKPHN